MSLPVLRRTSTSVFALGDHTPLPKLTRTYASGNLMADYPECFTTEKVEALVLKIRQLLMNPGPTNTWWDVLNYSEQGLKAERDLELPGRFSAAQSLALEKLGLKEKHQLVEAHFNKISESTKTHDWETIERLARKALHLCQDREDWFKNSEQAKDRKRYFLCTFAMAVAKQKNPKAESLTKAILHIQDAYPLARSERQQKDINLIAAKLLLKRDIPKHAASTCDQCKANHFFKQSETRNETEVTDHSPCEIEPSRTISLLKSTPETYSPSETA